MHTTTVCCIHCAQETYFHNSHSQNKHTINGHSQLDPVCRSSIPPPGKWSHRTKEGLTFLSNTPSLPISTRVQGPIRTARGSISGSERVLILNRVPPFRLVLYLIYNLIYLQYLQVCPPGVWAVSHSSVPYHTRV